MGVNVIAKRMPTKMLAALSRRVGTSLAAGIDERKVWQSEIGRASAPYRPAIAEISRHVDSGHTLSQALESDGSSFPPLFRELAALGNATGRLSDILLRLADQYEHQVRQRREFLATITWPVFQLIAALTIIGLLIWVMGAIGSMGGQPIDILGIGLVGTQGLIVYIVILAALFAAGYGLFKLLTSDAVASGPSQQILLRVPVVGGCVESILLSRFAWALGISLEAGMEVRRALPFAFRSTGSGLFIRQQETAAAFVGRGQTVEEALTATGLFPRDFLDIVSVGETTGQLAESLLHQGEQLQQQARASLATLAKIAGFMIWGMIALLIGTMVIRIAYEGYIKPMQQFL